MKYRGSLYVVKDIEETKKFYSELLGLRVIQDFGANITMTGGISFQSKESWLEFINEDEDKLVFGGNNTEIYLETEELDNFIDKLNNYPNIELVHLLKEHNWGQRGIRFYDPDHHIIEVSETLKQVCQRFSVQGLSTEQISKKTMLTKKMVERLLK